MTNYLIEKWNEAHRKVLWLNETADPRLVEFVRAYYGEVPLSERSKIKMLDLGCGAGTNSFFLSEEGFDAHGIDISEVAIRNANHVRDRITSEDALPHVRFTVAGIQDLPFADGTFDAAIDVCGMSALHPNQIRQGVRETLRVLKPGGRLMSLVIADDCDPRLHRVDSMAYNEAGLVQVFFIAGMKGGKYRREHHIDGGGNLVSLWYLEAQKLEA